MRERHLRALTSLGAALVALLGVAPGVTAQSRAQGSVRGSVVEAATDRPVAGATVTLSPDSLSAGSDDATRDAAPRRVLTDRHGSYGFRAVEPGRYRVEVTGLGYRTAVVWIDLPAAWKVRRSVGLEVEPVALDPIEITYLARRHALPAGMGTASSRPDVPGDEWRETSRSADYTLDARVLDPDSLPGIGTLGEPDVFRALQRLPGVSGRGDFSATLWTRDAPWGLTRIVLDGLPLYDPLHLGGVAAGLTADGLGQVTLLPGVRPPSAAEGAAGTLELTTRAARRNRSLSAGLSSMAARVHAEDRWMDDRIGVSVTGRRSWWDVVHPPTVFTGEPADGSIDYRFSDLTARFDARLGDRTLLEAGGLREQDRIRGDIPGLVSSSAGTWGNAMGWVGVRQSLGNLRVSARLGGVRYAVKTRPLPWASFKGPDGLPSLGLLVTRLGHTMARLEVAGGSPDDRLEWAVGYRRLVDRLSQQGPEAEDHLAPGVATTAELRRGVAWTQAQFHLGRVDLAGGASFDLTESRMRLKGGGVRPSVRARWAPLRWLSVEAATGVSRQFEYPLAPAGVSLGPSLGVGHVWILAGEDRPPLTSRTSTLGAAALLPWGVQAHLTGWTRHTDGVWMAGISGSGAGQQTTPVEDPATGSERGQGVELGLSWTGEAVAVEGGYSLGRSHFSGPDTPTWASPAQRTHSVDLHASGRLPVGLTLGAELTAESGWPLRLRDPSTCNSDESQCAGGESRPNGHSDAPSYASLDLSMAWTHTLGPVAFDLVTSLRNTLGRDNTAAYKATTCTGVTLISIICESGQGRFSPGLTRPTPSIALQVRF